MDKPQNASDAPAPSSVPLFVAVGVGLVVVLIVAMSGLTGDEGTNWLITGGAGLVAAVAAYLVVSRRGNATERRRGEQ